MLTHDFQTLDFTISVPILILTFHYVIEREGKLFLIPQLDQALRSVNKLISCLRLKYEEQLVFLPEDKFLDIWSQVFIEIF